MISVLYISNRYGGLDILKASLQRQSFKDFEIVFVDGLYDKREKEVKEYLKDFKLKYIKELDLKPEEGYKAKLARCINQGFKNCEGELIVSIQDYIYVPHYGLQKYWDLYLQDKNALVTGISHQYHYPCKDDITNPEGLITVFESDYTKKPDIKVWQDPRDDGSKGVRQVKHPIEWELNWASIPTKVVKDLGGCDESYDLHGFGYDNANLAIRVAMAGYPIVLDSTNEVFCFRHDDWWVNEYKAKGIQPHEYHIQQITKLQKGEIPVRLNYLD